MLLRQKVGDIRPAILPPQTPTVGESPDLPFQLPEGFKIGIFAPRQSSGQASLGGVRDLEFTPGGTLLASIPSSGRVVALPDKDLNGVADEVRDVISSLDRPHGIAFYSEGTSSAYNGNLFIAEETRVVRYRWDENTLSVTQDKILFSLPKGGRHFTRSIVFDKNGRMFVSIGSTCDVCFEKHPWLAAIIVSDSEGNNPHLWAKGLRNSVFIAINPTTGELWGTEMGRDFLGDNLPPDEINVIWEGKDYGWPICYGDKIHDNNFDPSASSGQACRNTEAPVYEIAAHSAPLGLTFINSPQFPKEWQGDLLVAYHGSWNRSSPIGYKVVRLNVDPDSIGVRGEEEFLSGFLSGSQALGRPVDVIFDKQGSLYISDDKAGVIYKIIKGQP